MRTINSAKNLLSSLIIMSIMTILGFVTRKIFVDNIGVDYLGLNGLLLNILGVVSLLEGGFGTSVVYNLYKPLAERNEPRIIALVQLYRKIYKCIALGIFLISLFIYPFLSIFIKDVGLLPYVSIVYFIFLFNTLLQYFTAYKWAIINADQKAYKLTVVNLIYQVGLNLGKLAILYYTKNYILYLVIEALFGLGLNLAIVRKANQLYPYIVTNVKYVVDKETKKKIITNVKALFLHSIGGYFMHSTDNLFISSFIGISIVGIYSNYTLITNTINTVTTNFLNSFSESVGNLIATETSDKVYNIFELVFFANFLIVSISTIIMYNTITPFVSWWLGTDYLLSYGVMIILLLKFYILGMRSSVLTFKVKSGIFTQDRFSPLLQGVINLILSFLFVEKWGIIGVLLATVISVLSVSFWQFPRLIYKYTFKRSLWGYFRKYVVYTFIALLSLVISSCCCQSIQMQNLFVQTVVNGTISLLVVIVVYLLLLGRDTASRDLFRYVYSIIKR